MFLSGQWDRIVHCSLCLTALTILVSVYLINYLHVVKLNPSDKTDTSVHIRVNLFSFEELLKFCGANDRMCLLRHICCPFCSFFLLFVRWSSILFFH